VTFQFVEQCLNQLHNGVPRGKGTFCHRKLLLFILTAIRLTPSGSSTVHIFTQNSTQNTENGTHITVKRRKTFGKCGPCPVFACYPGIYLTTEENYGNHSVRVVEKYPDIPVAAVQYTFTHKQHTVQHNETEYTERIIQNNKII
jgi:hypothetical protein